LRFCRLVASRSSTRRSQLRAPSKIRELCGCLLPLLRHDFVQGSSLPRTPGGKPKFRKLFIGLIMSCALSSTAFAQGTAAEAKAMLEKAIAAVKADKAKAIASFNNGTDGFKDRDLYPFCFNIADGITQA